jgi:hypothetical protein
LQLSKTRRLTPAQEKLVAEIRRVAEFLGQGRLSQRQFDALHAMGGVSTAGYQFGSWNEAVKAAGLAPNPPGRSAAPKYSDAQLLAEIIRVHRLIGAPPSERRMAMISRYSLKPYKARWGTFTKARSEAYSRLLPPE